MTQQKSSLGKDSENLAVGYLIKKGFRILERNFRCRMGEIDIVARDGEYLVFVEVRSRSSSKYGLAQETIGLRKRNKLRQLANYYLLRKPSNSLHIRFDVVAVNWSEKNMICHIENAF